MGKDLNKAFLEAAEIAKSLPENLQQVGFSRALDELLGGSVARTSNLTPHRRPASDPTPPPAPKGYGAHLVEQIDRTAYPDIGATGRVADMALKVLLLADKDHGVDGLTAAEIAEILNRKFRIGAKSNSVSKALEREVGNVDVRTGPAGSRIFHLMAPGEEYVARLRSGAGTGPSGSEFPRGQKKRRKIKGKGLAAPAADQNAKRSAAPTSQKKVRQGATRRTGPKAAIGQLIDSGFFNEPRGIGRIQEELQHRRGLTFSIQDLAPALVRSIRDNSLKRERNEQGQYEYSAP